LRDAPATPPSFVRLLLPEDGVWVPTRDWDLAELPFGHAHVLWGDRGDEGVVPRSTALRRAARRDVALCRLRLRGRVAGTYRVSTPTQGPGTLGRNWLRRWIIATTVVDIGRGTPRSPITAVLGAARVQPVGRVLPAAGGGVLQFARLDGADVVLRAGYSGEPSDPSRAADGLERLREIPAVPTPDLLASGTTGAVSWTVESRLPGRPVQRLTSALLGQSLGVLRAMPDSHEPITSVDEDLATVAAAYPDHRARIERLAREVMSVLADEEGVFAHGDLWPGNLLHERGRLEGVVDWGSWRSSAAPGADLLQLCAAAERPREPLGAAWQRRPWLVPETRTILEAQLQRRGARSDTAYLDVLGIAWWAAKVAGTLERFPERARDTRWTSGNVNAVIEAATA
jgi:hypothetical protein